METTELSPEMISLITEKMNNEQEPEQEQPQRDPALKLTELPVGRYTTKSIIQIHSKFGENYIIEVDGRQYFSNKKLKNSISNFAKNYNKLPVCSFNMSGISEFVAKNGQRIRYADINGIYNS